MNNEIFAKRFSELMEEKSIKQKELAILLGVSQPQISDYKKGAIPKRNGALQKISELFNVDISYLLGDSDIRKHDTDIAYVPVVVQKNITAPVFSEKNYISFQIYLKSLIGNKDCFILKIQDSRMSSDGLDLNDYAFFEKHNRIDKSGDIVAVLISGEIKIRKAYIENDSIIFTASKSVATFKKDSTDYQILGKYFQVLKKSNQA